MGSCEDPDFYAYAEDVDKAEALVAAVSALYTRTPYPYPEEPGRNNRISVGTPGKPSVSRADCSVDEIIELIRGHFTPNSCADVRVTTQMPSRIYAEPHWSDTHLWWESSAFIEPLPPGPPHFFWGLGLCCVELHNRVQVTYVAPIHETCPIPIGAAIQMHQLRPDMEFVLLGLCASPRIKIGGMSTADITGRDGPDPWCAPLEWSATYNADHHVARNVALSWLYLHNGIRVDYKIAGLPLDELAARVEAAPKGTKIGLAWNSKIVFDHHDVDRDAWQTLPPDLCRRGPRDFLPEDEMLSREEVLAILKTPSEELLRALETVAAKPDPIWIEAERGAREVLDAAEKLAWEARVEIDVDTDEHRYFLAEHAPYHVRRLEKGGVMMTTHFYRTLWPLWSEALRLLGIRP